MKTKSVTLSNPRTGEVWVCENFDNRRCVDGVDFVEVHLGKDMTIEAFKEKFPLVRSVPYMEYVKDAVW